MRDINHMTASKRVTYDTQDMQDEARLQDDEQDNMRYTVTSRYTERVVREIRCRKPERAPHPSESRTLPRSFGQVLVEFARAKTRRNTFHPTSAARACEEKNSYDGPHHVRQTEIEAYWSLARRTAVRCRARPALRTCYGSGATEGVYQQRTVSRKMPRILSSERACVEET